MVPSTTVPAAYADLQWHLNRPRSLASTSRCCRSRCMAGTLPSPLSYYLDCTVYVGCTPAFQFLSNILDVLASTYGPDLPMLVGPCRCNATASGPRCSAPW